MELSSFRVLYRWATGHGPRATGNGPRAMGLGPSPRLPGPFQRVMGRWLTLAYWLTHRLAASAAQVANEAPIRLQRRRDGNPNHKGWTHRCRDPQIHTVTMIPQYNRPEEDNSTRNKKRHNGIERIQRNLLLSYRRYAPSMLLFGFLTTPPNLPWRACLHPRPSLSFRLWSCGTRFGDPRLS